jgi:hypothetical protein
VRFKFKLRLTQAIKIHHHQLEWNHQVLKFIKNKIKFMVTIMDGALIKEENKVVKLKKMLHKLKMLMMDQFNVNLKHNTQEYIKWFNRIIPSTTYLGVSKEAGFPEPVGTGPVRPVPGGTGPARYMNRFGSHPKTVPVI